MNLLLELPREEIHLWLSFYDEITDERLLASYRQLLAEEEREHEQRFYFSKDKHRYLVTRAMVRTVLSRYAMIDPGAWIFSVGPYGRPVIANESFKDEKFSFNISHTDGLIVLAVTKGRELGVDVENTLVREVSIDIADRFFSPEEVAALAQAPLHRRQDRFFEYWTFKEAYIKARGMGLSLPLDKFSFSYPHIGAVDMTIHPDLADDPSRWQFWQFKPTPHFLIAVCAERIGSPACRLAIRKVVPAVGDAVLPLLATRHSR